MINKTDITGVILAGGQARRMGGQDKGLIKVNNTPMIKHIINIITPQVNGIFINANRNQDDYAMYGYPVISDAIPDYCGPLAGISAALSQCETSYLASVPCDSPFIPKDLIDRLIRKLNDEQAEISVAHSNDRMQPVFSIIHKNLSESLIDYLHSGQRKIDRWFEQHKLAITDFSDCPSAFDNINTPEDVERAEQFLNK